MKILRILLGIGLLPVAWAVTQTVYRLTDPVRPEALCAVAPEHWALAAGLAFWFFLYATVPRPMRSYVLAHELTHALWGWMMGSRVSRLKIGRESGSVTLSKSNIWITLAPYFFPFYTMCLIVLYGVLSLFVDQRPYTAFWLGAIGFTWGFHATFTVRTLLQRQSDVLAYGRLLSYTLIYTLNLLGIGLWIIAVTPATLEDLAHGLDRNLRTIGRSADAAVHAGARALRRLQ
jgi:hypothetical protein